MTEKTVQVGERLAVSYDITNRGQSDGEQTVELTLDGEVVDSEALVLDAESTGRMSLVTDAFTDEDDGQIYEVEIVTDDRVAQVMTVEVIALPDSDVYLHDDWGDNQLTSDRDESGTTTHNGEEGVYRPEWDVGAGSPEANNELLDLKSGDAVITEINANLDEELVLELDGLSLASSTSNAHVHGITIFAQTDEPRGLANDDDYRGLREGYYVDARSASDGQYGIRRVDSDGSTSTLIEGDGFGDDVSIVVTRQPNGDWQMEVDGDSLGSAVNDTDYTDANFSAMGNSNDDSSSEEMELDEFKLR